MIDIYFRSTYVTDPEEIDEVNNIYLANKKYKNKDWQDKYKFVLLKILFESYDNYKNRNRTFKIPKSVKDRTTQYLQSSCDLLGWFNNTYTETKDTKSFVKIKEVFTIFSKSEFYNNLSKIDKKNYNLTIFENKIKEDLFLSKLYRERTSKTINGKVICCRNILLGYKERENDEEHDEPEEST